MSERSHRPREYNREAKPLCVHVIPTTAQAGAETRARELLMGLAQRGEFELELVYFDPGVAHDQFVELGLPMTRLRPRARFALDFPRLSWALRRRYRGSPPAVVHTWLPHGNIVGLLAFRRALASRIVVTQCGGRGEETFYPRQIQVQKMLLGRADHAISNSTDGVAALKRWGMQSDDTSLVLNGVSPDRIVTNQTRETIRSELAVPTGAHLVVVATRVNDRAAAVQKDIAGLLRAIDHARARLPDLTLRLVGPTDGELATAGITLPPWAEATGFVKSTADYLNAADVVVIPSRSEGMSNVACEALMLGRPVVSTRVGDHADIVTEAGGAVVAVGDPVALADGIVDLLESPPASASVRAVAQKRLDLNLMVEATSEIYARLLARPAYHS